MIPYYQPHYPTAAEELTVPQHMLAQPAMPQYGINFAATPQDRRDKKRKIDAEYRQRCKVKKEKREIELQHLREENALLKRENEFCREENDSMALKLRSKEVEIGNLKSEICNSKKVISKQEILLDTLSQKPFLQQIMHGCNRLEVALLENERNILYQDANWDGWESERKQLLDEIEKLKHRNVMLKMQNQVLGDKILSQKDTEASMRSHAIASLVEDSATNLSVCL
uniref:BZIP domain-containing protein n=1 Tax=Populus davidiana TaxID=266767 RepID=A0A6M2EY81_9ROSI